MPAFLQINLHAMLTLDQMQDAVDAVLYGFADFAQHTEVHLLVSFLVQLACVVA